MRSHDAASGAIVAEKFPRGNEPWKYNCFFSTNLNKKSFEFDLEKFLGRYGNYTCPSSVEKGKLSSENNIRGLNLCGAFECSLNLKPGEEKKFVFVTGITKEKDKIGKILQEVFGSADELFADTVVYWKSRIFDNISIESPEKELDTLWHTTTRARRLVRNRTASARFT